MRVGRSPCSVLSLGLPASLRSSLPILLTQRWLAALEAWAQLVARALEKGGDDKGVHGSPLQTCGVQRWAECCLSTALAPSPVSSEPASLGSAQTSSQIPLGSLLAALTHMCCFRIKELGTVDTGSGPMDKGRVGPVKTHLQVSQKTQGPLLSPHPSLTQFPQLGPGNHQVTSQSSRQHHGAESLRPRAARDLQPPPRNSLCLGSLFHPFPLCLWSSSPISPPWLQRASCDSRIRAKQFPRDGETALQPREPWAPPPLPSGSSPSPGSSTGFSCVLQNSHWITSVIASRCGPQKHKGAMSSSLNYMPHARAPSPPDTPDFPVWASQGPHPLW